MLIEEYKKQCERTVEEFKKRVLPLEYIKNGIFLSEGFAFCAMVDLFKANIIIESGTAGGYSTEIWARYFNKPIYSVDSGKLYGINRYQSTQERLSKYPHVQLVFGDSFQEVPRLIRRFSSCKIALFIDGPKGELALNLAEKSFFCGSNLVFAGIHDLYEKKIKMEQTIFYTDDDWFLNKYFYLNQIDGASNSTLIAQLASFPKGMVIGFSAPWRLRPVRFLNYVKYLSASAFVRRQIINKIRGKYAYVAKLFSRRFPVFYFALKRVKGFLKKK